MSDLLIDFLSQDAAEKLSWEDLVSRMKKIESLNRGIVPYQSALIFCETCGANDGLAHPDNGYCYHCWTDNWESSYFTNEYAHVPWALRTEDQKRARISKWDEEF